MDDETVKNELLELLGVSGRQDTSAPVEKCKRCLYYNYVGSSFYTSTVAPTIGGLCNNCINQREQAAREAHIKEYDAATPPTL